LSQKSDTYVAHYNFNAHQPIRVIFGRNVAERVCYQTVICIGGGNYWTGWAAGRGPYTFWPLSAVPISGQPTFEPRSSH